MQVTDPAAITQRSASASSESIMATNDNTETSDSEDVLLTEEDILAFFLSKSGEVRNSELVTHFRRALKTGQHRATNRQHFPRFINSLATVTVDDNGRKVLTLKKKFRPREGAASMSEEISDVDDRGTTTNVEETTATASHRSNNNNNEEQTSSKITDGQITGSIQDDTNQAVKDANCKQEQSNVEDITASKRLDVATDDDQRQEELLASSGHCGQQAEHLADKTACSHGEDAQSASVTEKDADEDDLEVPETSTTMMTEENKTCSSDEETQQQENNGTEADVFDDGVPDIKSDRGSELEETGEKPSVAIVVEDCSQSDQADAGQQSVDEIDGQDICRVRQLAQRIDEAAGKRSSMAVAMATKQVRSEPGRPPSDRRRLTTTGTPYDFTMNESQRDWTLQASYSDYQALAKLLSKCPGCKMFSCNSDKYQRN